jgi:hypothetical protein
LTLIIKFGTISLESFEEKKSMNDNDTIEVKIKRAAEKRMVPGE